MLDAFGRKSLLLVGGGIIGFVALIDIVSMYGAVALFLLYYTKVLGGHSWWVTAPLVLVFPLMLFFFFEGADADHDADRDELYRPSLRHPLQHHLLSQRKLS